MNMQWKLTISTSERKSKTIATKNEATNGDTLNYNSDLRNDIQSRFFVFPISPFSFLSSIKAELRSLDLVIAKCNGY